MQKLNIENYLILVYTAFILIIVTIFSNIISDTIKDIIHKGILPDIKALSRLGLFTTILFVILVFLINKLHKYVVSSKKTHESNEVNVYETLYDFIKILESNLLKKYTNPYARFYSVGSITNKIVAYFLDNLGLFKGIFFVVVVTVVFVISSILNNIISRLFDIDYSWTIVIIMLPLIIPIIFLNIYLFPRYNIRIQRRPSENYFDRIQVSFDSRVDKIIRKNKIKVKYIILSSLMSDVSLNLIIDFENKIHYYFESTGSEEEIQESKQEVEKIVKDTISQFNQSITET